MKLLIVAPISSPIVQRLRRSLEARGCNVILASHDAANIEDVINLGNLSSFLGYFHFRKIRKLVKKYKPDVVHAHILNHYGLMCFLQSRPVVVALWGSDVMIAPYKGSKFIRKFHLLINKLVLRRADMLHTSGIHVAEEAEHQYAGVKNKIETFYWGFPLLQPCDQVLNDIERKLKKELSLNDDRYIIFPRGLSAVYNPENVALIINKLLSENITQKIIVLRGFSGENDVKNFLSTVDINKIIFVNRLLSEGELYFLYSKTDVHISIPISDSLGAGVVEPAMLGSFPVLSNLPSYRDYINNNEGYLLRDYDQSLSDLIKRITSGEITNSNSNIPNEEYREDLVVNRLMALYQEVVKQKE